MPHPLARNRCRLESGMRFRTSGEEFSLGGAIGDGAVGLVRKAMRTSDQRVFAVKFLAPDPKYIAEEAFDDVASRFKREGERGAQLEHPQLMKIHALCSNDGGGAFVGKGPQNPFIVMEYLPGKTVEGFIRRLPDDQRGGFSVTRAKLLIAVQIASALDYLHKRKLIHRDVKPANAFLSARSSEGPGVRLGDFGIMKWGDFHASLSTGVLTATNQRGLGTLKYMSPEQAIHPRDVTVRSDIYSFGITLFELFTGQILAGPHHVFEVMMARLARGTVPSRYFEMGYRLAGDDELIAELILDMHLRGASGRPTIEKVLGRLSWEFESRFDMSWDEAVRDA